MEENSLNDFNNIVSNMTGIYGAGKVCPWKNEDCNLATDGLTLEPGISGVMDNPADHEWDELIYYWKNWRDVSGKKIRSQYARYVELSNVAAKANSKHIRTICHDEMFFEHYYIPQTSTMPARCG